MAEFVGEPQLHLVTGAPRSGTTLLQAILSCSTSTSPLLGESRFLRHLLDFYSDVCNSWQDDSGYYFNDLASAAQIVRNAIHSIFGPLAEKHNSSDIVTKSPEFARRAAIISEVLPDAKRYAILRDVRDVIASQMAASVREVGMGFVPTLLPSSTVSPDDNGERDIWTSLRVVEALSDKFLSYYGKAVTSGWHLVSYEALVTEPLSIIRTLQEESGLDLKFDPDLPWTNVEFDYLRESTTAERAWRSDLWGSPINASKIGYYKRVLPPQQVQLIERRCAAYMERWRNLTEGGKVPDVRQP